MYRISFPVCRIAWSWHQIIKNGHGALPIFLDDSLAQYDDRRAEAAAGFLKEYSADGQVIMFTCHGAVRDAAVGAGAAEIDLGEKNGL